MGFQTDYQWGKEQEDKVFDILKPLVGSGFHKIEQHNLPYDFKDDVYLYEVKARRCPYKQYPTTLLPYNKVLSDKQYFLFAFTDGVYYLKYDPELFYRFEVAPFKRFQRADYNDKPALYYYIPINQLKPISEFQYK